MSSLKDRVYIVTGAAGGIGRAFSELAAQSGAQLLLSDLDAGSMNEVAEIVRRAGSPPLCVAGDSRDACLGRELASAAMSRFGRVDGVIPCAGIIKLRDVVEVDPDQWDAVMGINLRGVFFLLQEVSKAMLAGGRGGSIVTISSTSAAGPRPNNSDYGVSKAGIEHLTRTLALRLGPNGIRVNAVSPGVIETAMWQQVDTERGAILGLQKGGLSKKLSDEIPLQRLGAPRDVAEVIRFLLSDEAAYVTGQVITVDGGYMLNHA